MTPSDKNIFSGKYSKEMWQEINSAKTKKKLRRALFGVCCKLQELESRVNRKQTEGGGEK